MKNKFKTYIIAAIILIFGIILGATLFTSESQNTSKPEEHSHELGDNSTWTCSMHPQIRKDEPGDCPICGMDLIPANQMEKTIDPDAIKMSKTARKLAQVETMIVGSKNNNPSLNLSGRLEINQDKTHSISANYEARIEKLYVSEEGEKIEKGQVIAELYAPDIQVLKSELDLAKRQADERLLKKVKQKIQNYGLTLEDIQNIENSKLKLRATKSGVITELKVEEGDNLKTDQILMSIADLSTLWAVLDIYESDLNKIEVGDKVEMTTKSNENISGKVTFISPILNDDSRSAKARVVIDNQNIGLKPGIFITATLKGSEQEKNEKLMVPKSAVLWTGKRSVVYKQLENENGVYFKMKIVEVGNSTSEYIEILSGLASGDEIVTHGAFSIDSEAQLSDKPSMMNPDKLQEKIDIKASDIEISNIEEVLSPYFEMKNNLVNDDFEKAKQSFEKLKQNLSVKNLKISLENNIENIEELRDEFQRISEIMIQLTRKTEDLPKIIYIQNCPMADNNSGADWLSYSEEIRNPYFGASMLKCGSVIDSIQ
ncbi:efflux RND transporter periplasmic adaptor subunit [Psychroflexus aestuariivivens]|uniref:efflux RND transporter periplasmic adaptor subunit n=1 Tax=Psychroflexus aestuariivivens TaxID=1795040 RepID=UPI000FD9AD47|nr:efflux RND transporter periplasmic adaptor subunit [Psychroflexus aestuariivivens]